MKLPTEVARNQTPIIRPPMRSGASFVIALRPTGLRQSSPNVCSRYTTVSQSGLTCTPPAERRAATIRTANPAPTRRRPSENLTGVEGSWPRRPSDSHSHANIGANAQTKSEFIDWNQLLGYDQPKIVVRVSRSANRLRVDPACSKSDQNSA